MTEWMAYFIIENEDLDKKIHKKDDRPVEDKLKTALRFPGAKVK